ncbi:MAG: hypothetical protein SGARI_003935, partial [Bacillariaceae sp.]
EFGPAKVTIVPRDIADRYVRGRYGKRDYCSFPFEGGDAKSESTSGGTTVNAGYPYWQLEQALNLWKFPQYMRTEEWLPLAGKADGNSISKTLTNLDAVEIENSIAPSSLSGNATSSCADMMSGRPIRVVGWNAARGKYWSEFADMVQGSDPDLILLNEMDLGMARSGNLHTTQQLALRLGMNYAWGIEFVELTNGNREEQNATHGVKNFLGLHGNAILSKCPLYDAQIFRDELDRRYFSNRGNKKNAGGTEVRLGGRMALFARTGQREEDSTAHFIAGSMHKVLPQTQNRKIWSYFGFGTYPDIVGDKPPPPPETLPPGVMGIISSGDHESLSFCPFAGMNNLDRKPPRKTFPASCDEKRLGHSRGDQFCGNMKIFREDEAILPCYRPSNNSEEMIQLSDHSIIEIVLSPMGGTGSP